MSRAAIITAKDLLTLPLLDEDEQTALNRLFTTISSCVPLSYLAFVCCEHEKPRLFEQPDLASQLPFSLSCECENNLFNAEQFPVNDGWCYVRVLHGHLHGLIARTHPKQQLLLQHLLQIAANHYSLLQADKQLEQFNSPLLNRIPFWQEKIESFTRLLRMAGSLPARQLFAQLDSTLRFWMGAKEILLLQKTGEDEEPVLVYPQEKALSPELIIQMSDDKPQQKEEGCLFWYSFPIQLRRQHHSNLVMGLQRLLVPEDRQVLFFVAEQLGLMAELYELRQMKNRQAEQGGDQSSVMREMHKSNQRLQRQIKQREEQERQLQLDAQRDPLTQVANRAMFMLRLDQAFKHYLRYPEQGFAILLIDVISLREINDLHGEQISDLLLKNIAEQLKYSIRQNDMLARLSNDEFIIYLDASHSTEAITPVISRILKRLQSTMVLDGQDINIHANLGVATVNPGIEDIGQLLRQADIATFQAKRRGENQAVFYSELCDMPDRLSPEQALQQALSENRILPYFQPIMRLRDRRVVQIELLARLLDENGEMHDASSFIPLAEQSDLILDIDRMMLRHACGLLQGLFRPLMKQHSLRLSINISGKHLASRELTQQLLQIIQDAGVPTKYFVFELKERDMTRRDTHTLTLLHELRAKGICIAIDDFGTGFSSLNALFHYPVDFVKIDDSFTHRLLKSNRDRALIRAIRDICHDLGMHVIVEGVEQREQHLKLSEMDCDLAQGYFFSAPLPPDALFNLLPSKGTPRTPEHEPDDKD